MVGVPIVPWCACSHVRHLPTRAVNDQLVDTYQLKSLDGQFGSLCVKLG